MERYFGSRDITDPDKRDACALESIRFMMGLAQSVTSRARVADKYIQSTLEKTTATSDPTTVRATGVLKKALDDPSHLHELSQTSDTAAMLLCPNADAFAATGKSRPLAPLGVYGYTHRTQQEYTEDTTPRTAIPWASEEARREWSETVNDGSAQILRTHRWSADEIHELARVTHDALDCFDIMEGVKQRALHRSLNNTIHLCRHRITRQIHESHHYRDGCTAAFKHLNVPYADVIVDRLHSSKILGRANIVPEADTDIGWVATSVFSACSMIPDVEKTRNYDRSPLLYFANNGFEVPKRVASVRSKLIEGCIADMVIGMREDSLHRPERPVTGSGKPDDSVAPQAGTKAKAKTKTKGKRRKKRGARAGKGGTKIPETVVLVDRPVAFPAKATLCEGGIALVVDTTREGNPHIDHATKSQQRK